MTALPQPCEVPQMTLPPAFYPVGELAGMLGVPEDVVERGVAELEINTYTHWRVLPDGTARSTLMANRLEAEAYCAGLNRTPPPLCVPLPTLHETSQPRLELLGDFAPTPPSVTCTDPPSKPRQNHRRTSVGTGRIGAQLHKFMLERDLSARAFSEFSGIAFGTLAAIRSGRCKMCSPDLVKRIRKAMRDYADNQAKGEAVVQPFAPMNEGTRVPVVPDAQAPQAETCPNCGGRGCMGCLRPAPQPQTGRAKFCHACGFNLTSLAARVRFCPECGEKVLEVAA